MEIVSLEMFDNASGFLFSLQEKCKKSVVVSLSPITKLHIDLHIIEGNDLDSVRNIQYTYRVFMKLVILFVQNKS